MGDQQATLQSVSIARFHNLMARLSVAVISLQDSLVCHSSEDFLPDYWKMASSMEFVFQKCH